MAEEDPVAQRADPAYRARLLSKLVQDLLTEEERGLVWFDFRGNKRSLCVVLVYGVRTQPHAPTGKTLRKLEPWRGWTPEGAAEVLKALAATQKEAVLRSQKSLELLSGIQAIVRDLPHGHPMFNAMLGWREGQLVLQASFRVHDVGQAERLLAVLAERPLPGKSRSHPSRNKP